jgi:hypothetical protein
VRFAALALAGCNSVFGNNPVQRTDAQYFDALIGPSQCPPVGQTPRFSTVLHQDFIQNCMGYRFNSGRAASVCTVGNGYGVFEGPIDQPLQPVPELVTMAASAIYDRAVLSSDAQTMFLREVDFDTGVTATRAARHQIDGTWQLQAPPELGQNPNDLLAAIARGPNGDHALVRANDWTIHEWIDDGGTWREAQVHVFDLDVYDAQLSADGLRVTLYTSKQEYLFSDRPDEDSPFREPEPLLGTPNAAIAPTITEDCARLYVTGLGSVFYVQQSARRAPAAREQQSGLRQRQRRQ